MNPTFRQNHRVQTHVNAVQVAVLKLSMDGYEVVRFTGGKAASIEIDRPFAGVEPTLAEHGDKTIASCDYYGCRLYWTVPKNDNPV